jgi:uncharacterized protein YjbJ (UPF0337 family)
VNKDRAEGKVKDVAGRVQRQVGEWTGDTDAQVKGAIKQAEGKAQNAWGKAKDAVKRSPEASDPPRASEHGEDAEAEDVQEDAAKPRRRSA